MNNYEFVKFAANRFGIDETLAESMVRYVCSKFAGTYLLRSICNH